MEILLEQHVNEALSEIQDRPHACIGYGATRKMRVLHAWIPMCVCVYIYIYIYRCMYRTSGIRCTVYGILYKIPGI